jgi:hypothetical protein
MKLPGFTAEASTYRTGRHYIGGGSNGAGSSSCEGVTPAYRPGSETQSRCQSCLDGCTSADEVCVADAWELMLGCIFPPDCAAAAAATGEALTACNIASLICKGACEMLECCPKICGLPDPFDPGSGCCDHGEHCVDENDPNARDGCCPSSQSTCGGHCCAPGDTCCGDSCCAAGNTCQEGVCCPPYYHVCGGQCCAPFNKCCNGQCCSSPYQQCHPTLGTCWAPPRPLSICRSGWTRCGGQCCPPGKQCCIPPGGSLGCYEGYECIA